MENAVPKIQMDPDLPGFTENCEDIILSLWKKCPKLEKPYIFKFVMKTYSNNKNINLNVHNKNINTKEWDCPDKDYSKTDIRDQDVHCICTQPIKNRIYIKSKLNGNVLRVGSCCIKKLCDDETLIASVNEAVRDINYIKNGKGDKKKCKKCKLHRIGKNSRNQYCEPCYKEYRNPCYSDTSSSEDSDEGEKILPGIKLCKRCKNTDKLYQDTGMCEKCNIQMLNQISEQMNIFSKKNSNIDSINSLSNEKCCDSLTKNLDRKCLDCNININELKHFKKYCAKCFMKSPNSSNISSSSSSSSNKIDRKCDDCGVMQIQVETWKKRCQSCFSRCKN